MEKTGWTPAHEAAKHNYEEIVAVLTDAGKDVELLQREKVLGDMEKTKPIWLGLAGD